ncbi:MAG: hypothetical protein U0W40_09430 [Acidimicrobiia bacterium]
MKFVQTIEFTTTRYDEVAAVMDEWESSTASTHRPTRAWTTRDRDRANTYVQIVEFPSYDDAMKNSELPETDALAQKMMALCDGPPIFRNLDVVREANL